MCTDGSSPDVGPQSSEGFEVSPTGNLEVHHHQNLNLSPPFAKGRLSSPAPLCRGHWARTDTQARDT